jgi:hypothetical protein
MAKKGALAEKAAELGAAVEGLLTDTPVAAKPVKKKAKKKTKKTAKKTAKKANKAPKKAKKAKKKKTRR